MIAEYQYHPLSRELLHTDFVEVSDETPVDVKIPLRLTGRAKGVVMGGMIPSPEEVVEKMEAIIEEQSLSKV